MKPVLCICIQVAVLFSLIQGECRIHYVNGPPTKLNCNPFNEIVNPPMLLPRFLCIVVRTRGIDNFAVNWYHNDTNGGTTKLNSGTTVLISGLYLITLSLKNPFNENSTGEYFCQVTNTTGIDKTPLKPSNKLFIQEPAYYRGLSPCPSVVLDRTPTVKCADLNIITTKTNKPQVPSPFICQSSIPADNKPEIVWIAGFVTVSILALVLLLILLACTTMITFKKCKHNFSEDNKSGMPADTCRKSLQQTTLSTGLSDISDTEITPQIHLQNSTEDYVDCYGNEESTHPFYVCVDNGRVGEGPFYVQPVCPQPKHSGTPYHTPPIKTIEGKVYAIADLSKRDNTIAYQRITK